MMHWKRMGRIFEPDGSRSWMRTHAQTPLVDLPENDRIRIYFGTRDDQNRTVTAWLEVDSSDPKRILAMCECPALGLGSRGAFDDSGAMPSWIVPRAGERWMFYTGWNTGGTVPYRNAIGAAVGQADRDSFQRNFRGPLMDRSISEPYFCGTPCVLVENGTWRMWYLSCTAWEEWEGRAEPRYHIRYAESSDGMNWSRPDVVCIDYASEEEGAIARPSVLKQDGLFRMWFCFRGRSGYRKKSARSYRIGYAESEDGLSWKRDDAKGGLDHSEEGWDSEMVAYPYVFRHQGRLLMLYNGNGFGRSGFGYAQGEE